MIMKLESSGIFITSDTIMSKLILEVQHGLTVEAESVMVASGKKNYKIKCYNCGNFGHIYKGMVNLRKTKTTKTTKN